MARANELWLAIARAAAATVALALWGTAESRADAPPEAAAIAARTPEAAGDMLARLAGQRARVEGARLFVDDIAGRGRPWVGVVERRGAALWLRGDGFALRLAGPLARPRLAGPGYTVWVIGARSADGTTLTAERLGVLARPDAP